MTVRLLLAGIMFLLIGSELTGQKPPKTCSGGEEVSIEIRGQNKSSKSSQSRQDDASTPPQKGNPCVISGSQSKPAGSVAVVGEWDPMTDLDGPDSRKIVTLFVLGLLVSAPIFILVRRLRSRKIESEAARKVLE
jgi:hypothetical protein